MTVSWSSMGNLDYNTCFDCGIEVVTVAETSYQTTYRVDLYGSMFLYAGQTVVLTQYVDVTGQARRTWSGSMADGNKQATTSMTYTLTKLVSAAQQLCFTVTGNVNGVLVSVSQWATLGQGNWHYVEFDAAGGTGAPASQVKYYGSVVTLSPSVPKKDNYTFLYWKDIYGDGYAPGAAYGRDATTTNTMTAQWRINHSAPTAVAGVPIRTASADSDAEETLGEFVLLPVDWAVDTTGYEDNAVGGISAAVTADGETALDDVRVEGDVSGTSGTAYVRFALGTGSYASVAVTVSETATDEIGTSTAFVGTAHVPLEIAERGRAVGILSTAGGEGSISLGTLSLTGVNQGAAAELAMSRLRGLVEALNSCPREAAVRNSASGMHLYALETPSGVSLGGNSTGTALSAGAAVCQVYTAGEFSNRNRLFIRGCFHGHQSGAYASFGSDGHTITITTEQAPTLASQNTVSMFIPCAWVA